MAATTDQSTSPYETIELVLDGPVANLAFRRDEHLNAYSGPMLDEIERALAEAESDLGIRVLVLRGSKKAFCTGADLEQILPLIESGSADAFRDGWLMQVHRVGAALEQSRLVVVGVIEGFALAGGLELALSCDLLIAAENARIGDQHLNFDLIPGGGASQRLPRAIGPQRAKLLLFTARWVTGREAEAMGIVARAVPADELETTVDEIVGLIAKRGPHALERTKRLVNEGLSMSLADGLDLELQVAAEHMVGDEAKAGLDRFHARKKG